MTINNIIKSKQSRFVKIICQYNMSRSVKIYQDMPKWIRMYPIEDMSRYSRMCQYMSRYVRICQYMSKYVNICHSMLEYVEICQNL